MPPGKPGKRARPSLNKKPPKAAAAPKRASTKRVADAASAPPDFWDVPLTWDTSIMDHNKHDPWHWDLSVAELKELLRVLHTVSRQPWRTVCQMADDDGTKRHHFQKTETLGVRARNRLVAIQLGEVDNLFRLRATEQLRVWGWVDRGVFRLLWFDRSHKVYKTDF